MENTEKTTLESAEINKFAKEVAEFLRKLNPDSGNKLSYYTAERILNDAKYWFSKLPVG